MAPKVVSVPLIYTKNNVCCLVERISNREAYLIFHMDTFDTSFRDIEQDDNVPLETNNEDTVGELDNGNTVEDSVANDMEQQVRETLYLSVYPC